VRRHSVAGTIDLALRTPSGWHVVDHKGHRLAAGQIPRWAAYYAPQLGVYARALTELTGEPVVGYDLLFHVPGQHGKLTACDKLDLEDLLERLASAWAEEERA